MIPVFADVDWVAVAGVSGTLVVSILGSSFGLYQARKADKSVTTTKTIELGVRDLIDQYQEHQKEMRIELDACSKRNAELQDNDGKLRESLGRALITIADLTQEVSRLSGEALAAGTIAHEIAATTQDAKRIVDDTGTL